MTEWEEVGPNSYMDISFVEQAWEWLCYLKGLMLVCLDRDVSLAEIDVSLGVYTIPFPDYINLIEHNIDILTQDGYIPDKMKATVKWLGETKDLHRLDYTDVNRWFDSFKQIVALVFSIRDRVVRTETFCSGDDRTRQLFMR